MNLKTKNKIKNNNHNNNNDIICYLLDNKFIIERNPLFVMD